MLSFKTMKKAIKIFCLIFLFLVVGGFFCVRFAERQLIQKIPEIFQEISSPDFQISVARIDKGDCLFNLCLDLNMLTIHPKEYQPIILEKVAFEIPLLWPIRVNVKTKESTSWSIDATLGRYIWDIRSFRGNLNDFDFILSGEIDIKKETGMLVLKTIRLRNFLAGIMEIPSWMNLLVQNIPQEFILKAYDGALRFQGIPLVAFDDLK